MVKIRPGKTDYIAAGGMASLAGSQISIPIAAIGGGAGRGRTAALQFCRTPQDANDQVRQSEIKGDVTRKVR
jgi:hypothetical protein